MMTKLVRLYISTSLLEDIFDWPLSIVSKSRSDSPKVVTLNRIYYHQGLKINNYSVQKQLKRKNEKMSDLLASIPPPGKRFFTDRF